MSKHQSNNPEADREEPEVDLEPIRKIYDIVTKVLKLGQLWLLTEPSPEWTREDLCKSTSSSCFYRTFFAAFTEELHGFRLKYITSEDLNTLIRDRRPLWDAFIFLDDVNMSIYDCGRSTTVGTMRTGIRKLEIAREILGRVLDDLEADENPAIRPEWDREAKRLWYGKILCRDYSIKAAPVQFEILDAFQVRDWPPTVPKPWHDEKKLADTIRNLTKELESNSPIRFEVRYGKPAWFRFRPRSSPV
jgi:hypothetical protein